MCDYKVNQTTVVTTVGFLIGVSMEHLKILNNDDAALISKLESNNDAVIIRSLNNLRSNLMLNYKMVEQAMVYDLKNLDRLDRFSDDVKALEKREIYIIKANYKANEYIIDINELIANKIANIKDLFPEWVNWQYIKDLFIMPKGNQESGVIKESTRFCHEQSFYPYKRYINWRPDSQGNILHNDKKFLNILYSQHGDNFYDNSKVLDASEATKSDIYEFIDKSGSIVIVVDCENSDAYKLASVLTQLNDEEISTIKKIMLFDDVHTTNAWAFLEGLTSIPVEHTLTERINENKSLVDIKMGMGISAAFYKDNVDSFILFSSDSDFWGVISSLPEARFLVMVETRKCGRDIKEALEVNGTEYCYIDDFCTGNINDFKKAVLLSELRKLIDGAISLNAPNLLDDLYTVCRISASDAEKQNFYDRYIKKLSLIIDESGDFRIKIPG